MLKIKNSKERTNDKLVYLYNLVIQKFYFNIIRTSITTDYYIDKKID